MSVDLIEIPVESLVVVETPPSIVEIESITGELVELQQGIIEQVVVTGELIELETPVIEFVEIGIQGPQGVTGPIGPTGATSVQMTAPTDLGGNRVVTGTLAYADSADSGTAGKAIGITAASAVAGATIAIQVIGELNGFFGLTPDLPVYLSTSGTLTQTPPLSGYIQKMGVAINPTTLLINIAEPIVR